MNPSGGYALRPATPADSAAIASHRYPDESDAPHRDTYAQWVQDAIRRGDYLGLLALKEEAVIAGAGLVLLNWGPNRTDSGGVRARLVNVWTSPTCRREGLARHLTLNLLQEARGRGIRTISLSSTAMARPLYESLGFQPYPHEMLLTLEET